jgi:threonylcarbamoyladenosine tRNA methylthiotransferase MtaB
MWRPASAGVVTMKYSIVTFGCRVNQADSLQLEEDLRRRGCELANAENADLVIVNTCSVTASADQGARQTIRRIARLNPDAKIVATGCYATRRPDDVAALPGVVRVVRNDDKLRAADLLDVPTSERFGSGDGPCGDVAGARNGRTDRVHASRTDRMRRELLLLHHPDDARHRAQHARGRRAP